MHNITPDPVSRLHVAQAETIASQEQTIAAQGQSIVAQEATIAAKEETIAAKEETLLLKKEILEAKETVSSWCFKERRPSPRLIFCLRLEPSPKRRCVLIRHRSMSVV